MFWILVYPAHRGTARHAERHVRHLGLPQVKRSILRSRNWSREGLLTLSARGQRRQAGIRLTEAGVKAGGTDRRSCHRGEQKALLDFSVEEQAQLLTLTRRYNDALSLHFGAIGKEKAMSKPRIQLSDHFTYPRLLRFVAPSITMMIFTSIYGVVDGFFVSNYVGKTPFAALNFIMPFIMVLGGTGFMLGTGGSALVAKETGLRPHGKEPTAFSP